MFKFFSVNVYSKLVCIFLLIVISMVLFWYKFNFLSVCLLLVLYIMYCVNLFVYCLISFLFWLIFVMVCFIWINFKLVVKLNLLSLIILKCDIN